MRSRIAIVALLTSGLLMSGSGAALGVSALSTPNGASEAQYGLVTTTGPMDSGLVPSGDDVRTLGGPEKSDAPASSGREGATAEPRSTPAARVQAPRQLEANGRNELPFTGYAAIPLLLGGLILLGSGLLIRRGTRRDQVRA